MARTLKARVAELADAQDSGSCPGNWVEVQVLSRAFLYRLLVGDRVMNVSQCATKA
jgi:hypothetical protein